MSEYLRVPFEELQKVRFTINITRIVKATLTSLYELHPKVSLRLEYMQAHQIVQKVASGVVEKILQMPNDENLVYECRVDEVDQTPPSPDREYILLIEAWKSNENKTEGER